MIAVTIGVGPVYAEMARLAAARVAAMTGLTTHVLGELEWRRYVDPRLIQRWGNASCMTLKFRLFDIFPDADSILFFDADLITVRPWNPRRFAAMPELVCVRDLIEGDFVQHEARVAGIDPERYFNFGFFIANRGHAEPLRRALGRFDLLDQVRASLFEQTVVNRAFAELAVPIRYLDRRYNYLFWALESEDARQIPAIAIHGLSRRGVDVKQSTLRFLRDGSAPDVISGRREIDEATTAALAGRRAGLREAGRPPRRLELREDGTIGEGRTDDLAYWYVFRDADASSLGLWSRHHLTCALRRGVDRVWRGSFPAFHQARADDTADTADRSPGGRKPLVRRVAGRLERELKAILRRPLPRRALGRPVELSV